MSILFSGFLLLLPLVFSFQTNQIFEVNKFVFLLLWAAMCLLFFSWKACKIVNSVVKKQNLSSSYGGTPPQEPPFFLGLHQFIRLYNVKSLVWILTVLLLLSVLFSTTPIVSFFGSAERHMGFVTFLAVCIVAVSSLQLPRKTIFWIFALQGAILCLYAILQWFGVDPLFSSLNARSLSYRSFGFLGQPNFLAQSLLIPFFITLFGIFSSWYTKQEKIFFAIVVLAFYSFAWYATGSRAAMLGAGVGILGLLLWYKTQKSWALWAGLPFAFVAWIFVFFAGNIFPFSERTASIIARHHFWNDAVGLAFSSVKNFFFGTGPDVLASSWQLFLSYSSYSSEYFLMLPDRVHSFPLDVLVQYGALCFVCVFVLLTKTFFRAYSSPFLFAGLLSVLVAWSFGFFVITDLVQASIVIALIWNWNEAKENNSLETESARWFFVIKKILGMLLAVCFLVLALFTWHSEKSFFTMLRQQKIVSSSVFLTPFLETNTVRLYDFISEKDRKELVFNGEYFLYSSLAFRRIQFLESLSLNNENAIRFAFLKWWKSAGNNPLFQLRILREVYSLGIFQKEEYTILTQSVLEKFPLSSDSSFFAQKVWKSIGNEIESLRRTLDK